MVGSKQEELTLVSSNENPCPARAPPIAPDINSNPQTACFNWLSPSWGGIFGCIAAQAPMMVIEMHPRTIHAMLKQCSKRVTRDNGELWRRWLTLGQKFWGSCHLYDKSEEAKEDSSCGGLSEGRQERWHWQVWRSTLVITIFPRGFTMKSLEHDWTGSWPNCEAHHRMVDGWCW